MMLRVVKHFMITISLSVLVLAGCSNKSSDGPTGPAASSWHTMTSGSNVSLPAIWGSSDSNVFAGGTSGTVLHYNGTNWSAMTSGTTYLLKAVWRSSTSNIFATGDNGTILHYNGTA